MGLKSILRRWILDEDIPQPVGGNLSDHMTNGIAYTCVVYAIEGGFLIRSETNQQSNNQMLSSHQGKVTVQFCATAEEITEQIIAKRALQALTK